MAAIIVKTLQGMHAQILLAKDLHLNSVFSSVCSFKF